MNPYLKLSYRHSCDLGGIPYSALTAFRLYLYLDADVQQPRHELIEEGEENQDKTFIPTFRKTTKRYRIKTGIIPDHVADALEVMKLHDSIILTWRTGEEDYLNAVEVDIEYPFDNDDAVATITFGIGEEVVVTSCC